MFSLNELFVNRKGQDSRSFSSVPAIECRLEQLEQRIVCDVSFGFDSTRIHTISVDGVNLLSPTATGGGVYLIGSKTGLDDPSSNYISVGTNGVNMTNNGPKYQLSFWQKNGNTLGFRAEVGPIDKSQVDPRTQRLATVSLPFDFRKDVIDQFSFNGNRYFLNNSSNATSYSTGANVNFTSIPTPFPIRSSPNGPIVGYTGVADTKTQTTSGKLTGSFGSVTVNVLNSTHYKSMVFYNHFGTDNIELQFGSFKVGERATIEGEVVVSQNQTANTWTFQAESLLHQIGRRDADGWSVRNGDTTGRYMTYGPYTTSIPAGNRTATFRLMLDNVSADNNRILTIDVFDAATGRVVASRNLNRRQFAKAMTYQNFDLNFKATAGQRLEFRTFWHGGSYVRQDFVSVK